MKLSRSMQWVLFAGDKYYPAGGARDYFGSFATLATALIQLRAQPIDSSGSWAQLVNIRTGTVVHYVGEYEHETDPRTTLTRRTDRCAWREVPDDEAMPIAGGGVRS